MHGVNASPPDGRAPALTVSTPVRSPARRCSCDATGRHRAGYLPADLADVLAEVLNTNDPVDVALRRQSRTSASKGAAHAGAVPPTSNSTPARWSLHPPAPALSWRPKRSSSPGPHECPGEVPVFTQGGYMSWLEVCSWSDDIEVTLKPARVTGCSCRHALDPNGRRPASDRMAPSLEPLCGTALRSGMDRVAARGGLGRAAQWGGWR